MCFPADGTVLRLMFVLVIFNGMICGFDVAYEPGRAGGEELWRDCAGGSC